MPKYQRRSRPRVVRARRKPSRYARRSVRTYRRRRPYKARISKRRILNITSRKCQDTLLSITNIHSDGVINLANPSPLPLISPLTFKGNNLAVTLHCITARPLNLSVAGPDNPAGRLSNQCFIRGFKERLDFRLAAGETVQWRRVVFAGKGISAFNTAIVSTADGPADWQPDGHREGESFRSMINLNAHSKYANVLAGISALFKGESGIDYVGIGNAKLDRTNYNILSDHTVNVCPTTTAPYAKTFNRWHPINKTIVYLHDESGNDLGANSKFSTTSKLGCGDIYVLDFYTGIGSATTLHQVASQSTIYWHER